MTKTAKKLGRAFVKGLKETPTEFFRPIWFIGDSTRDLKKGRFAKDLKQA